MKVLIALATLTCLFSSSAALLLYEGFDYPIGQELGEHSSSSIWHNDKTQFTIARGNLEYPGLKTSTGNCLHAASAIPTLDSVRTLDGAWRRQLSGALYLSFILRLQSNAEITGINEGTSLVTISDTANHTQLLGINLLNKGDGVKIGILKYPSSSTGISSSAFFDSGPGARLPTNGTAACLIVAKYEWVNGASNDMVTIWVNPTKFGGAEGSIHKVFTSAGPDGTGGAGRLTFSRGPNVTVDELRIGQTWADVTPRRESPERLLIIVGVLAGGLIAAGFWITRLRHKVAERSSALQAQIQERQRAEHLRLVEQERARIAHDLHDELGADIAEVSMLATRAQSDTDSEDGRRCLVQMVDKTRQMVAKLEEIVWAMNPQHDSLDDLISYFSFFADRLLGLANIRLSVDVPEGSTSLSLESRVRHQLFLVFKETLANVIRHSGANEVRLTVRLENQLLSVTVTDNGCGLQPNMPTSGGQEGIVNMRRRMEKLDGKFEIAGTPCQGTTVKLSLPLAL